MKLNERGRGKFKPAPNYTVEGVKKLLFQKINEEQKNFELSSYKVDRNKLVYK